MWFLHLLSLLLFNTEFEWHSSNTVFPLSLSPEQAQFTGQRPKKQFKPTSLGCCWHWLGLCTSSSGWKSSEWTGHNMIWLAFLDSFNLLAWCIICRRSLCCSIQTIVIKAQWGPCKCNQHHHTRLQCFHSAWWMHLVTQPERDSRKWKSSDLTMFSNSPVSSVVSSVQSVILV